MKLQVNTQTTIKLWWPTRLLVQVSDTDYEYQLVGFGKRVVVCPRVAMKSTPNLAAKSIEYFTSLWRTQALNTFETVPALHVVSDQQAEEFVDQIIKSNFHLTRTDPERCVKSAFATLIEESKE
jgi:hypothetical protein